jgi:hypothetical protein
MPRPLALFAITGLLLSLACGAGDQAEGVATALQGLADAVEQEVGENAAKIDLEQAADNLKDAMKQLSQATGGPDPVDFRALKKLLPQRIRGFERTEATGEKTTMSGFGISMAKAVYKSDDGGKIEIQITDAGGVSGMIRAASFAWAAVDLEREWEDGFERTVDADEGIKFYEKYDEGDRRGEINGFVVGRFVVGIQGRKVDFDQLEKARDKVDFKALVKMKDEGKKPEEPKE